MFHIFCHDEFTDSDIYAGFLVFGEGGVGFGYRVGFGYGVGLRLLDGVVAEDFGGVDGLFAGVGAIGFLRRVAASRNESRYCGKKYKFLDFHVMSFLYYGNNISVWQS